MIYKYKLLLCWLMFAIPLYGADKSRFDVLSSAAVAFSLGKSAVPEGRRLSNDWLEVTLLTGGYFTIGTTGGLSQDNLDDGCGVTFGHPYALTSYPVISVEGVWQKFDDFFTFGTLTPQQAGDTLRVTGTVSNEFRITFSIAINREAADVQFAFEMENLGDIDKTYGFGLVLDPALGKWGDGHANIAGGFLEQEMTLGASEIPVSFPVWEKNTGRQGIGFRIDFGKDTPEHLLAANWSDVYEDEAPDVDLGEPDLLYDLTLKFYWEESIAAANQRIIVTTLTLEPPDFGTAGFLRWDLPAFLTLTDNLLFPRDLDTFVEISSVGSQPARSTHIVVEESPFLKANSSQFILPASISGSYFQAIPINSGIAYEDITTELKIKLMRDNETVDELRRKVFIPATPVSDTGLLVNMGSLMTSDFPNIRFTFEVRNEERDFLITNLARENVFLYENDQRLEDFSFGKDTTGGVEAADIIFVMDVTGSMSNEIAEVKNNIVEFADSLSYRRVDFRLGLVTFLDEIENVYAFTDDAQLFRDQIAQQHAHGGGDTSENSLAALREATRFDFRPNAKRIAIWITDANYHENDSVTSLERGEVVDELLAAEILVHAVGEQRFKSSFYDPITIPTGGNYYDIRGNFRDILLDVSRLRSLSSYLISYRSPHQQSGTNRIKLEIRYAGLGGNAMTDYTNATASRQLKSYLTYYPNPFNPQITFLIDSKEYQTGNLSVYNVLGQLVQEFQLDSKGQRTVVWDARNSNQVHVGSGLYIARLSLIDRQGKSHHETARIMYLK